jgi:hypothetical protein
VRLAQLPTGKLGSAVVDATASLADLADGDVVDLGLAVPRRYPPGVRSVRALAGPGQADSLEPCDTVVSVLALWHPSWTAERLAALAGRLRPGGSVLFVEPVAVVGPSGWLQRLVTPLTRWRYGLAFDRRVPDDLRAAGLTLTTLERTTVDRRGRVRTLAVGVAQRRCPPGPRPVTD